MNISHTVLTTLKTTGLPISEVDFPSITICGQGSISKVMENVLEHQFHDYLNSLGLDIGDLGLNIMTPAPASSTTPGPSSVGRRKRSTQTEQDLRKQMLKDLYPGLDSSPLIIPETMQPTIPFERAIDSSVLIYNDKSVYFSGASKYLMTIGGKYGENPIEARLYSLDPTHPVPPCLASLHWLPSAMRPKRGASGTTLNQGLKIKFYL